MPSQASQVIHVEATYGSFTSMAPMPSHCSQAPSGRLNVNSDADRPLSWANSVRMRSKTLV